MEKSFENIEDIIADDSFLAWYSGECAEKADAWISWYDANPKYNKLADEAIAFMRWVHFKEKSVSEEEVAEAFEKVQNRIDLPFYSRFPARKAWLIAASFVLVILGGFVLKKVLSGGSHTKVIETEYGQLTQKTLPDGSQVTLNAHSKVSWNNWQHDSSDRELWLKGEAFFHVKRTAGNSRFIVHTERLDVIVTGTQFNVENLNDKTNVLLTEGSVILKLKDGKQIFMKPGDFVSIEEQKGIRKAVPADTSALLAWRNNKLSFDNTPISEAVKIISRHYGVVIKLADSAIGEKTITGMMPNNNLDVFLESLEAVTDFKVSRNSREIIITAN